MTYQHNSTQVAQMNIHHKQVLNSNEFSTHFQSCYVTHGQQELSHWHVSGMSKQIFLSCAYRLGHGIAQDSLEEEGRAKTALRSWFVLSLHVVAPRTPPQAPPPLEFTDAPLAKNYASAASISTSSSLFSSSF